MAAGLAQAGQLQLGHLRFSPPPTFDGDINNFEDWKRRFKAYINLYHNDIGNAMDRAETADNVITDDLFTEEQLRTSRVLHYALLTNTSGTAAVTVQQNGNGNGFESWRLLCNRFSIPSAARSMGRLQQILIITFNEQQPFEPQLSAWETLINRYETDVGTPLADQVKLGLLMSRTTG